MQRWGIIDAFGTASLLFVRAFRRLSRERFHCRKHLQYFQNQLDQNAFGLLIGAFDFELPLRKKKMTTFSIKNVLLFIVNE